MSALPGKLESAYDQRLNRLAGLHVVSIGGGTGPFALLSRLKSYPCIPTAIVNMADSGGSSRRLMDEFGQLPLGDLRRALVALSRKGVLWRDMFTYRFPPGAYASAESADSEGTGAAGVGGHSLGNLILSALQSLNDGDLLRAIRDAQELLDTAGHVLPATLSQATLCAELEDGEVVSGETEIDRRGEHRPGPLPAIRRVFLRHPAPACVEARRAIRRADLIILGPGDLYTSIVPNLLVDGIAAEIRTAEAEKVYVCNVMTKHGETDGYRASDFVRELQTYLGGRVDRVVMHQGPIPASLVDRYAAQGQTPVEADAERVRELGPEPVLADLATADRLVRHDPDRLIPAILASPRLLRAPMSRPRSGDLPLEMGAL